MTAPDRCPVCDRPQATAEQWARVERDENIPAAEGAAVCWGEGEPQCTMARVDWRARALAAEAQRDEARRLLAAAACGKLRRCETCGERIAVKARLDAAREAVQAMEGGR